MRELTRSNDPIRLSFLTSVLAGAGIESIILDSHTSIVQGSLNMLEQRLMVAEPDHARAMRLMTDAEAAVLQGAPATAETGDLD